tara:strand:- start:122 stop:565 length:444 start_codon:yes stop_codon:yes gene_type:complete
MTEKESRFMVTMGFGCLAAIPAILSGGLLIYGVVSFFISEYPQTYYSQTYECKTGRNTFYLKVNADRSFIFASKNESFLAIGKWKKGDDGKLINCSGMIRNSNKKVSVSYNKNTLDLVEFKIGERKLPLVIFRKPHLKKSNYEINIK